MRLEEGDKVECNDLQEMLEVMRECEKSGGEVILQSIESRTLLCTKSTRNLRIIRKT